MLKSFFSFVWELFKIAVIALLIVIPIRYFVFQPFFVRGYSMEPNFHQGDYLIVDELSFRLRDPQRGEVIVMKYPLDPSQRYIKRIIGLPGETLQFKNGKVVVKKDNKTEVLDENNYLANSVRTDPKEFQTITLGQNEYFVLGDNRVNSADSRYFGPVPRDKIIGRVFFRALPFIAFAKIPTPVYGQ